MRHTGFWGNQESREDLIIPHNISSEFTITRYFKKEATTYDTLNVHPISRYRRIVHTLRHGYMKEIIADAHKARFSISDGASNDKGIDISEAWMADFQKLPYH